MAVDVKVPSVGESVSEGSIATWFKKDGDSVRAEEPLFELETEKATTEVASPASGVLHISVPQGQTVPIGTVVARVEAQAASPPVSAGKKADAGATPKPSTTDGSPKKREPDRTRSEAATVQERSEPLLSPAARHLVEERGLDPTKMAGSGPGGRVIKEDVLEHLKSAEREPASPPVSTSASPPGDTEPAAGGRERRQRMSTIRGRIAERLVAAQHTAAMLTTFNEADLSAVSELRKRYKEPFQAKHGVNLGLMSFFVKASVEALRAYPIVNAWIDGSDIVFHDYYNLGVAVSTDKGLMVPVLRDADRMNFADIEKRLAELAEKARAGKIAVDDLQGGTFTITNGGVFGSLMSTPILNPPQSAILGMHAIQQRPVVRQDQIVIRPMMYLALSYDHRLVDGRDAVRFLVRIKECIENPERMLLEV
jgi:2-oxoglutarate dehydrogenase E2 component (dihydrolipoamide succinyltransferase)